MFETIKSGYRKVKAFCISSGKKIAAVGVAVGGAIGLAGVKAHAALSIDQAAVVTEIETLYTDMTVVAWGFILTVTSLFLGMKIFKKVMGRAT